MNRRIKKKKIRRETEQNNKRMKRIMQRIRMNTIGRDEMLIDRRWLINGNEWVIGTSGGGYGFHYFKTKNKCILKEKIIAPSVEYLSEHIKNYDVERFDINLISIIKNGRAESVMINTDGSVISSHGHSFLENESI